MDDQKVAAALTRRTVVLSAAWAVPVVSFATAAPALAASGPAPLIPPLSASTWTLTTSGAVKKDGVAFGTNATGSYVNVTTDPALSSTYTATISTTISVVAGVTYYFTWSYVAYANNPRPMTGTLSVDGAALAGGITTATMSGTAVTGTVTQSYTATTTGTVTLAFVFSISATATTGTGDDILVYTPTVTTSP